MAARNKAWDPKDGKETPPAVALNRRRFLRNLGIVGGLTAAAAGGIWWAQRTPDNQVLQLGQRGSLNRALTSQLYPARREAEFQYGRAQTDETAAARYTNFYEFSRFKNCYNWVEKFQPDPWEVVVDGLCRQPLRLSTDDLLQRFRKELCERQYRHRCVETWAMAIPWTGIPLANLLQAVDPLPQATHVRFVSFDRPEQAARMTDRSQPWPYNEGLTIAEAMNPLSFLATGMYGHPLLKQHGAPLRLVVPWKYGYKSGKSLVRIELVSREPATFWSTLAPDEYPFQSNVNPAVSHPRWSQASEWMLGTNERHPTQLFNGYGEWVADLYPEQARQANAT